ncbi:MAG: hypothetical protein ACK58U_15140 [Rubrivivax sp.]
MKSDGTTDCICWMSVTPRSAISLPPMAVIEYGTSITNCLRLDAVTSMTCLPVDVSAAVWAMAGQVAKAAAIGVSKILSVRVSMRSGPW